MAGIDLERLSDRDAPRIQALLERCTAFQELVHGIPTRPDEAERLLRSLPPRFDDRLLYGVRDGGPSLAGVLDVAVGYPAPGDLWIALLVLDPAVRGRGVGAAALEWLVGQARGWAARGIGLIVQQQNPRARTFWERNGFRVHATLKVREERLENQVWRMWRDLGDGQRG